MPAQRLDVVLYPCALLVGRHAEEEAGVEDAVTEDAPISFGDRLADFREHVEHSEIERDACRDLVVVEDLEHPPEADTVAVVNKAVAHHVRNRHACPELPI